MREEKENAGEREKGRIAGLGRQAMKVKEMKGSVKTGREFWGFGSLSREDHETAKDGEGSMEVRE